MKSEIFLKKLETCCGCLATLESFQPTFQNVLAHLTKNKNKSTVFCFLKKIFISHFVHAINQDIYHRLTGLYKYIVSGFLNKIKSHQCRQSSHATTFVDTVLKFTN